METHRLPPRLFASAQWIDPGHPQRAMAEAFVAAVYRQRFDAALREFMPHLLAFRSADGALQAVVGLRCAGHGPLFVERYFDHAVEQRIGDDCGRPIARHGVVEIGNFAACSPGAARALILCLIPLLRDAGLRWVAFVATRQLRNAFARLGLRPRRLETACGERLGGARECWGRYYDEQPEVLYGDLATAEPQRIDELPALPAWQPPCAAALAL